MGSGEVQIYAQIFFLPICFAVKTVTQADSHAVPSDSSFLVTRRTVSFSHSSLEKNPKAALLGAAQKTMRQAPTVPHLDKCGPSKEHHNLSTVW